MIIHRMYRTGPARDSAYREQSLITKTAANSLAFFTSFGAMLEAYGTSTAALMVAIAGAVAALVESEDRDALTAAMVLLINVFLGVAGGAVLAEIIHVRLQVEIPMVLIATSFLGGYTGHLVIGNTRVALARLLARWLSGGR